MLLSAAAIRKTHGFGFLYHTYSKKIMQTGYNLIYHQAYSIKKPVILMDYTDLEAWIQ